MRQTKPITPTMRAVLKHCLWAFSDKPVIKGRSLVPVIEAGVSRDRRHIMASDQERMVLGSLIMPYESSMLWDTFA